jgi:hypothetical protein
MKKVINAGKSARTGAAVGAASGRKPSLPDPFVQLFPKGYELVPQLNETYELKLAYWESRTLSKTEAIERSAYFKAIDGEPTYHFLTCTGTPLKVARSSSARLRTFFTAAQFKTGYATHGLFPYRGKFHPQMIRALINIMGVKPGELLLDPMMGSGTSLIESAIMGIPSYGVDISPFCAFMTQAKLDGLTLDLSILRRHLTLIPHLFRQLEQKAHSITHTFLAGELRPILTENDKVDRLLALCLFDALGYAERVKGGQAVDLFEELLTKYISVVEKFKAVHADLQLPLGSAVVAAGDARKLELQDQSVAGVIFSPPYSFAIDYLENDSSQLDLLRVDTQHLRESMIGLRGKSKQDRVNLYFEDMTQVLSEIARVLRPGRFCCIVVGSNTNQLEGILGTEDPRLTSIEDRVVECGEKVGLVFVEKIARQITGIRNLMRDEYILLLQRPA